MEESKTNVWYKLCLIKSDFEYLKQEVGILIYNHINIVM